MALYVDQAATDRGRTLTEHAEHGDRARTSLFKPIAASRVNSA